MKKLILIFLLVLGFAVDSFAVADSTNITGADGKRQGYWIILGKMQKNTAYSSDAKVEEGRYKDGQKTGIWIAYFPNGNKKSEFTYVNNRPNGHAIVYNDNGKKAEEGTWVGTRWVGPYTLFYEDGTPRQNFNYSTVGQRDGAQTYNHPNGKKAIEVSMKAGKEDGWMREYDENGVLIRETFYSGGVMDPSKTKEYKSTAPVSKAPEDPANDKKAETPPPAPPTPNWGGTGPYTLMKGGQVSQKGTFRNFKLVDGEAYFYDNNGMLIQIKKYKDGKYIGDSPIPVDANK
jgi:antitoxin component YwqK of YwqJK toxin-antitoxin module